MVQHLRPAELFRNANTRPWAIGGLSLVAIGGAIAAFFAASAGLAVSTVLIVFLLGVVVDFLAENEAKAVEQRTELKDLAANLKGQAPGVLATYSEPRDIPFIALLQKAASHDEPARRVQLVGWYFPYFVEGARFEAFREFFAHGGQVDIVIPDVSDKRVALWLAEMRSSELDSGGAARLTCSSLKGIDRIRREAQAPADALRVFTRRTPINYAAYCFAGRDLILGPYEHAFDASARAPRLHFDLAYAGSFAAFWRVEFTGMTQDHNVINVAQWLDAVAEAHWPAAPDGSQSPGSGPGSGPSPPV
ncbi:MAG TPA: hypothetical protein VGO80_07050 [Solirubrobacteraceae bacterium]|jgi:hypothetical protein|nr:hypothetical protein [Solirubrobacteraceae bacterium]